MEGTVKPFFERPGFRGASAPVEEQEGVAVGQGHRAAVAGAPLESRQLVEPAPPLRRLVVELEAEPS